MNFYLIFFIFILGVQLSGCGGNANAESPLPESEIEALFSSIYIESGIGLSKQSKVVTSQSEFESELLAYTSESAPIIDFNENRVLFLTMGTMSTGGHSVAIDNSELKISDNAVTITVTYNSPGVNCILTQALTDPYLILRIPTRKMVLINEQLQISDCE